MTDVVVVGVDGSDTSKKAAARAGSLAEALRATLHVVMAFDNDKPQLVGVGSDQVLVSQASEAGETARRIAAALRSESLQVEYYAVQGSPAQALIKQAEAHRALMIVVGSRGMRGLGRVLGSVATNVAHNAPCDVYIVKTD